MASTARAGAPDRGRPPTASPGRVDELDELAASVATLQATGRQALLDIDSEHTKLRDDEDFWARCAEHFSDELLADLALSCAMWVGMGRMLRTLDVGQTCKITIPSRG